MDNHHFLVEHCDIPEGMTLTQWRREQAQQRAAAKQQDRLARRSKLAGLFFRRRTPQLTAQPQ